MQRILILGGPGSGKSTLTIWLSKMTGLPPVFADHTYFRAGWEPTSLAERLDLQTAAAADERWIFDGCLSELVPVLAVRADKVIVLDIATPLRLWRILRRAAVYNGRPRPGSPDGCPEVVREDWLRYALRYRRHWQPLLDQVAAGQGEKLLHLKGRRSVARFIQTVTRGGLAAL